MYQESEPRLLELSRSTAALIPEYNILGGEEDEFLEIAGRQIGNSRGFCADEPFGDQISAANCSGFLVAPNILVTAGHCMGSLSRCQGYKFVFGFHVNYSGQTEFKVPRTDVYSCKSLVKSVLNSYTDQLDYAVIELDRDVEGREPLKFRKTGKIANGEDLVVIGHPSGLPTKIADGAQVRSNENEIYFTTNLDTYGGNSGSAVFNAKTGEVEGILVRGETDYVSRNTCTISYQCEDGGCRGEDVTRITNVAEIQNF